MIDSRPPNSEGKPAPERSTVTQRAAIPIVANANIERREVDIDVINGGVADARGEAHRRGIETVFAASRSREQVRISAAAFELAPAEADDSPTHCR